MIVPVAMTCVRVGVDIVEVRRVASCIERWGDRFLRRIFTEQELRRCAGRPASLAARFAAKEAVAKALGVGIGAVAWREVEILNLENGEPAVLLHGRAEAVAALLGATCTALSLSHSREHAVAVAVLCCRPQPAGPDACI
jgi:holo-[acyl-carrier protein] synthase